MQFRNTERILVLSIDVFHLPIYCYNKFGRKFEEMEEMVQLDSSKSTQTSLQAIREGNAGLNVHRQTMLDRVPESGDFASFRYKSIEPIDLAYLTARTGHEFAILRGKDVDILFHGEKTHCQFAEALADMLMAHKLIIIGHSHPGEDDPIPSRGDRKALKKIGQKRSTIVSGRTGKMRDFGPDEFSNDLG